jgi:hypothetical protein
MTGTDAHYHPAAGAAAPVFGQVEMLTPVFSLRPFAEGAWTDVSLDGTATPLQITLPSAGTYRVGGTINSGIDVDPAIVPSSGSVQTRLFNVTAGAALTWSDRLGAFVSPATVTADNPATSQPWSDQAQVGQDLIVTVAGPTTLRLQARYDTSGLYGTGTGAEIVSAVGVGVGPTLLNYSKL